MADCVKTNPFAAVRKGQNLWIKDFALMVAISTPNKHHATLATLKKRRDWLWKHAHDPTPAAYPEDTVMYAGLYTMVIDCIAETLKWSADDPATHHFHRKIAEIEAFVVQQFIAHNIHHDGGPRPLGTWKDVIHATDEALFAINLELHKKYGFILTRA